MNIYGMTLSGLREYFRSIDENPAKADIVYCGVYKRGITDLREFGFCERVNEKICAELTFGIPKVIDECGSGSTSKLLLELSDGEAVETVLMRQRFGNYVCVSTQVGCNMGCVFCQSGRLKKRRNLKTEEICGQIMAISRRFNCGIDGVSVMGIGEPFDNFEPVAKLCEIVSEDKGLAVGRRHITVSTCGIVPKIYEYADFPRCCNLAISLHAPNGALRDTLMPINKKYPLEEVLNAAEYFSDKTSRRVTLEYVMLKGINDSPNDARQLAELIGGRNFYVNLIPYNQTDGGFERSSFETISEFCKVLKYNGVIATIRREFGAGVNAACGQLMPVRGNS